MGRPVLQLRSSAGLYGADNVVLSLVPALASHGFEPTLLCLQNPLHDEQPMLERARALRLPVRMLPCSGRLDRRTIASVRVHLKAQPDAIVHVHDYKSAFYAFLARGFGRQPIVATCHGPFADHGALALYHRIELALTRRADRVCAVSAALEQELQARGVAASRVVLIENGIDTLRFRPGVAPMDLAARGVPPGRRVIGTAMRLAEEKNPVGLVEAYAAARSGFGHCALVVAGDGPLRGAMQARAQALGVADELHLLGACRDLERFYAALDVFVLPSFSEGLPLALLEAMACERPVVASAVGQVPQVLAGLEAGLVAPGDVPALAQALRAAITQPPAAAPLRQRVIERFSVQRMAADYAAVYEQLAPAA